MKYGQKFGTKTKYANRLFTYTFNTTEWYFMLNGYFVCFVPNLQGDDEDSVYSKNVNCDQVLLLSRRLKFPFANAKFIEIILWLRYDRVIRNSCNN